MSCEQLTTWFIVCLVLLIATYDLWQALAPQGVTISFQVRSWARCCPWLPWATLLGMGYLWWHLFWE